MKKLILVFLFVSGCFVVAGELSGLGNVSKNSSISNPINLSVQSKNTLKISSFGYKNFNIKEYADANRKVVAIRWDGESKPDFEAMLGKGLDKLTRVDLPIKSLRMAQYKDVSTGMIVDIIKIGNLNIGKAYLQTQIPNGVNIDDL